MLARQAVLNLVEPVEYMGEFVGRDANTGIAYEKLW
jgi:hypothetical protein